MNFIFAKSLKGKLLFMTSIPVMALIIIGVMSYLSVSGQIQRSEELSQFIPLTAEAKQIVAHSHALPRYIWLSLGNDTSKERRMEYVKKASDELRMMKERLNFEINLVKDHGVALNLSPDVETSLKNLEEPIKKMEVIFERVRSQFELFDPEQDKLVKKTLLEETPPVAGQITKELDALEKSLEKDTAAYLKAAAERSKQSIVIRTGITLVSIILSAVMSLMIAISITRKILDVTTNVSESTKQVASASHQIANASQQLASVSQTQASSIEETSAALAEMSGMVEKNTKNAETTAQLAQNVRSQSEKSVQAMAELIQSMHEILESNKKIESLVKVIEEIGEKTSVIDEIVFQTKLLSFNASVEAERAGEHGRGFAVVAQEVGNLAQMSGRSALEISAIVKNSVKEASQIAVENKAKVENGNKLVEMTEKILRDVENSAKNVLDLSEQVLNASKEQNTGINQINSSVDNINKTTQETASTAEESASAAEELSSQSTTLQTMVQDLRQIVTGNKEQTEQQSQVIHMNDRRKEVPHLKLAANGGTASSQLGSWEKL